MARNSNVQQYWALLKSILLMAVMLVPAGARAQDITTETVWRIETGAPIYGHPVAAGDTLYIGGEDGLLRAINRQSGKVVWSYEAGAALASNAGVDDRRVYIAARDGSVHAVFRDSGQRAWRFATKGEKQWDYWDYRLSTPVADHERVYFGSGDHHIYGLNKRNGALRWTVETGGIVHGEPVIDGEKVIVGGFDGVLYGVDRANGVVLWTFKTVGNSYFRNGAIAGSASVSDGTIYFGSRDYNLYAVLAETGTGAWNYRTPSWVITKPLIANGKVYVATSDGPRLFGFTANGRKETETRLSANVYGEPVALGSSHVAVAGKDGRVQIIAIGDGTVAAIHDTVEGQKKRESYFGAEGVKLPPEIKTMDDYHAFEDRLIFDLGGIIGGLATVENVIYYATASGAIVALQVNGLPEAPTAGNAD